MRKDENKAVYRQPSMKYSKNPYTDSGCYSSTPLTINGQSYYGYVLYPDDYNGDYITDESNGAWTWERIAAAGIVFLPKTGYRTSSTSWSAVSGTYCYYLGYGTTSDMYTMGYSNYHKPNLMNGAALVRLVTEVTE